VLRVRYGAGQKSVPHSHPAVAVIFLTDGHFRFNDQGGGPPEAQGKAGDVMLMPATTHQPENLDQLGRLLLPEYVVKAAKIALRGRRNDVDDQ
jgi:quercetin dioxygenase-like cupin family protein